MSETLTLLRESAAGLLPRTGDLKRIRALRFTEAGFDAAVWRAMCEMGWPALRVPETRGGAGLGLPECVALAEEFGAALAPEPWVPVCIVAQVLEGAELAALQGALAFLDRPAGEAPDILFEVHRHYVDWTGGLENTGIVRLLTDRGYKVFALRDFNSNYDLSKHPIELIPLGAIQLEGPPHGFNMVAVKDASVFDGPGYRIVKDVSPKYLRHKDPALHHPAGGL
jgi:hypothetical protein